MCVFSEQPKDYVLNFFLKSDEKQFGGVLNQNQYTE